MACKLGLKNAYLVGLFQPQIRNLTVRARLASWWIIVKASGQVFEKFPTIALLYKTTRKTPHSIPALQNILKTTPAASF